MFPQISELTLKYLHEDPPLSSLPQGWDSGQLCSLPLIGQSPFNPLLAPTRKTSLAFMSLLRQSFHISQSNPPSLQIGKLRPGGAVTDSRSHSGFLGEPVLEDRLLFGGPSLLTCD